MNDWVECVPNFSEGRRPEVINALAAAITAVPGVYLLDQEMDPSHHRSVFTFVGPQRAVLQAAFAAANTARDRIDLNEHRGEHPRIGATDVVPFVPLGQTSMESCVALARELGRRMWDQLGIPVYLYEEAATRPDRRDLAALRKGEFEGLREEVKTHPDRRPDFGEQALHPTAGATVVGARWFLIAFNAYLNTNDIRIAKEIAKAIRFSSGGFRYVKALGFSIQERDQVQISMNLVNYRGTPVHRAVEFVRREAQRYGVTLVSTEVVGLIPQEALDLACEYYLQLERFSSDQILERRIQKAVATEQSRDRILRAFLDDLSSSKPTPGGGSVAALAGSLAAALGAMVSDLTLSKNKHKDSHEAIRPHLAFFSGAQEDLFRLIEEDAQAYESVVAAYKLPKGTESEASSRQAAVEAALRRATEIPLQTVALAVRALESLQAVQALINPNALSDLAVGAQMAVAAGKGGIFNIRANLASMPESNFKQSSRAEADRLWERTETIGSEMQQFVLSCLQ